MVVTGAVSFDPVGGRHLPPELQVGFGSWTWNLEIMRESTESCCDIDGYRMIKGSRGPTILEKLTGCLFGRFISFENIKIKDRESYKNRGQATGDG